MQHYHSVLFQRVASVLNKHSSIFLSIMVDLIILDSVFIFRIGNISAKIK